MNKSNKLTIAVNSFSYKTRIPEDPSGHGGGFVFDCRGIHNPGRYERYQFLTGKDQEVIDFFKKNTSIDAFIDKAVELVDFSVQSYLERGFSSLMINFGCTGGQHRSVYCAEQTARILQETYPVEVTLDHKALKRE